MDASSTAPRIWLIGDLDRSDFAHLIPPSGEATLLRTVAGAWDKATGLDRVEAGPAPPELIVLWQGHPGEFRSRDVELLRRQFPLALWLVVLGSWCEGELRSGEPLVGVQRHYWHQLAPDWWRPFARGAGPPPPNWLSPVSAAPDELWVGRAERGTPKRIWNAQGQTPRVAIIDEHRVGSDLLVEICRLGQCTPVLLEGRRHEMPGADPVHLVLWWTTPECLVSPPRRTRAVLDALRSVPLVALTGFPRWQDRAPRWGPELRTGNEFERSTPVAPLAPMRTERAFVVISLPCALGQIDCAMRQLLATGASAAGLESRWPRQGAT